MTAAVPSRPIAYHLLPKRWFYGWYIALACGVLMFVGVGVGYYGLPVFLEPLKEDHGWSTTEVSWAPTIYFLVAGLTGAVVGPFIDRRGPMTFMLAGTIVNGLAGACIGLVEELWQLYAVYFVFAVAFGASSGVAVNAIMTRWFIRRRALAMSISSTGVSLGGVVISPLASKLIDVGGLELATPILGALVIVAGLPVILGVLAWDPARAGMEPDGAWQPVNPQARALSTESQMRAWSRDEAMRTVAFWALLLAFLLVLIAQTGYIIHQVSFLEERFGSRSAAALTISVTAFGSIVARLVVGIFADGVDRRLLSAILFVVQATCVVVIVLVDNAVSTWVLTLVFGFTIGNVYMMQTLLVGEIFGMVSFGSIFGLISLAGQGGSSLGPLLVGVVHDSSGGYTAPFLILAGFCYAAAAVVWFARPVATPASRVPAAESRTTGPEPRVPSVE
jgi:sugar phosphate permease